MGQDIYNTTIEDSMKASSATHKGMKLVSKRTQWVPGGGPRTSIELSTSIPYFSGLGKMLTTKYNHEVCIAGINEAAVSLNVGGPNSEKDKWEAAIQDWLATTDYLAEWEQEAANYRYVLSQVDLPAAPNTWDYHIAYKSFGVRADEYCALNYHLMMGGLDRYLSIVVMAEHNRAMAYIGVVEPDDNHMEYGTSYVAMGEYSLSYPVTVDSIRAVIGPAIDVFMGKLQELAGMDVVEEVDKY
jgi:hypothetical protein